MSEKTREKKAKRGPDFLIIGPQRSGTSWLNRNLSYHPQVWPTPIKELHYFNAGMISSNEHLYRYSRHIKFRAYKILTQILKADKTLFGDLKWDLHYFLGKRNDDWYVNLFRPIPGQVAGEATPSYAILGIDEIKKIKRINPQIKLIYLMRNPMERSWSSVTKFLAKKKKRILAEIPDEEIYQKLNSSEVTIRSNHIQSLENWESQFGNNQLTIEFFEEIVINPTELIIRIFKFLEITESDEFISSSIKEKVNSSGKYKSPIPPRFQIHLGRQYIDQLHMLSSRFGGATTTWLQSAESILANRIG